MWSISKALLIPLDNTIKNIHDIPHTVSYVIRKRQQVDNMSELPNDKRPPDTILWHDNSDKLNDWLDKVLDRKGKKKKENEVIDLRIPEYEIEG